jgi:hypothetical protein
LALFFTKPQDTSEVGVFDHSARVFARAVVGAFGAAAGASSFQRAIEQADSKQVGTGKVGFVQDSSSQVRFHQVTATEIRSDHIGITQFCPA